MNTRHTIAAGLATLTLAGGAAIAVPNLAQAETTSGSTSSSSSTSSTQTQRTSPLKASLDKLVKAGTLTQAQADKVLAQAEADRPAGGPGGHGHGGHGMGMRGGEVLTAAAKTLGLTEDALRTKLQTQTLGQVADAQKVSRDTLTAALQKAMTADAATRAKDMLDMLAGQGPDGGRGDHRPGGPAGQQGGQQGQQGGQQGQQGGSTSTPSASGASFSGV